MKEINMYIRGICKNTGQYQETRIGKFVVMLEYKGICKNTYGSDGNTTSNRMLLMAVIEGIKLLKEPCSINLYTPTNLGFKSKKSPNSDLIDIIKHECDGAGHILNEIVSYEQQNKLIPMLKKYKGLE